MSLSVVLPYGFSYADISSGSADIQGEAVTVDNADQLLDTSCALVDISGIFQYADDGSSVSVTVSTAASLETWLIASLDGAAFKTQLDSYVLTNLRNIVGVTAIAVDSSVATDISHTLVGTSITNEILDGSGNVRYLLQPAMQSMYEQMFALAPARFQDASGTPINTGSLPFQVGDKLSIVIDTTFTDTVLSYSAFVYRGAAVPSGFSVATYSGTPAAIPISARRMQIRVTVR
jgi:hypothetical protein